MAPTMRKPGKRTKGGPKRKYETGAFTYANREWYQTDVGGKKLTKKQAGDGNVSRFILGGIKLSLMRLINYSSAGMVVLTLVAVTWQATLALDTLFHIPWGWAPALAIIVMGSIFLYDWSRKWLDKHDRHGVSGQTRQHYIESQ